MYKVLKYNIMKIITVLIIFNLVSINTIIAMAENKNVSSQKIYDLKEKLDNIVPELQNQYGVQGTSIGIIKDGNVEYILNYGVGDKKENKLVNKETIFQVGSVSKSLTAWGVMRLVDEGKISLDDPVEKYLTRWHLPESKYNSDDITIRRLLGHTAGISRNSYVGIKPDKELPTIEQSLAGRSSPSEKVEIINEPGSQYLYTGGGYAVLQLVIEEVTKLPFEGYMSKEILKPLGMEHSTFTNNFKDINMARAYGFFGESLPNYNYTEQAAAGLKTNVEEFLKFMLASMEGNNGEPRGREILKSESIDLIANSQFGTFRNILPDNSIEIGHEGSNKGWTSQYQIIPEKKAGLVIFANSSSAYYLTDEVKDVWIEYETGIMPSNHYIIQNVSKVFFVIEIVLGLILIIYCLYFSLELKKKRRILFLKKDKKSIIKICLRLIVYLSIAFIWYYVFYMSNLAFKMPYGFLMITYLITTWSIVLSISALFHKNKG